jgi:hypothetical protein
MVTVIYTFVAPGGQRNLGAKWGWGLGKLLNNAIVVLFGSHT